jgi:hypothetical protein
MDDNNENFMAYIIASGTNSIATFTDEECSQVDIYLNIPPIEEDAAPSRTHQQIMKTMLETMRKVL